ncbi:MAG: aquaporin [Armatimonadetes bacterium]|nr:aquaporin [Akkermansiaceae bacterium]
MNIKAYAVEFISTFFLVLIVSLSAVFGLAGDFAPLAIGLGLAVLVYSAGHISGGHLNPAVTLGVVLRGKLRKIDAIPYVIAQLLGAVAAVMVAKLMMPSAEVELANLEGKTVPIILAEFLFTFALVWAVLNTATAKANVNNSFFGLSIGGTVLVGAFTVGSISLGAFNPAVAVGLAMIGKLPVSLLAIYIVTQLVAGALASLLFRAVAKNEDWFLEKDLK